MIDDEILSHAKQLEGYRVLPPCVIYAKIGQGGMGAVYRGRHLNLDIDVAVKCLKPGLAADDNQFVVRFHREAKSAAAISHQNVIRVYDVAEDRGLHFLIMEYVSGETARQRVNRKGTLKVGEAIEIVYGAALGLSEAHRKGIVHRDIKPDNILISSSGQVKVADLGLAKPSMRDDATAANVSMANVAMGTPEYMPPEQWDDTSSVTSAADVWALGATLYFLLVGKEAMPRDSYPRMVKRIMTQRFPDPRKLRADVPQDVVDLLVRATETDQTLRFQDGQEFAEAIERLETRRQRLADSGAGTTSVDPLLSPPPPKTLAKIRMRLQEDTAEVPPEPAAPRPTVPPRKGEPMPAPVSAPQRAWWPWAVVGALLLAAAVGWWWSQRDDGDHFAAARQFAAQRQWDKAIAATEAVHAAHDLPGRAERVSGYEASWARDLVRTGKLDEALEHFDQSLALRPDSSLEAERQRALGQIAAAIHGNLERQPPEARASGAFRFAGVLRDARVRELLLAGRSVALAAGAASGERTFAEDRNVTSGQPLPVAVTLVRTSRTLDLPPWPVTASTPRQVALAVGKELVLAATGTTALRVDAPAGARVTVADLPELVVPAGGDHVVFQLPAALLPRSPITVKATLADHDPAEAQVVLQAARPVAPAPSVPPAIAFRAPPVVERGVRQDDGSFAVLGQTAWISFQLTHPPKSLEINDNHRGVDETRFEHVLQAGRNEFRVKADGRLLGTVVVQRVERVAEPGFVPPVAAPIATEADRYEFVVEGDRWWQDVRCGRGRADLAMVRDPQQQLHWRGAVPLQVGQNRIVVEATSVFGTTVATQLDVTRKARLPRPTVDAVVLLDEAGVEHAVQPERVNHVANARWRLSAKVPAGATVLVQREPVEGPVPLAAYLTAGAAELEVGARNSTGDAPPVRVRVAVDAAGPVVAATDPVAGATVQPGSTFVVRGTWQDASGLRELRVGDVVGLVIADRDAAVTDRGSWEVRLRAPAAGAANYDLEARDAVGNRARLPLQFVVPAPKPEPGPAPEPPPAPTVKVPAGCRAKPGARTNAAGWPEAVVHVASGIELLAVPSGDGKPTFYGARREVTFGEYEGTADTAPVKSVRDDTVLAWLEGERGSGLALPTRAEFDAMLAERARFQALDDGYGEWLADSGADRTMRTIRTRQGSYGEQKRASSSPFLGFRVVLRP
jgi:hypothetical protein